MHLNCILHLLLYFCAVHNSSLVVSWDGEVSIGFMLQNLLAEVIQPEFWKSLGVF